MKFVGRLVLFLFLCLVHLQANAQSFQDNILDLSIDGSQPIGKYINYYQEESSPLSLNDVQKVFAEGGFNVSSTMSLNFGVGSKPVWLQFEVSNIKDSNVIRRLSIETSWLDKVSVIFISQNESPVVFNAGDTQIFSERVIDNRFFQFDHEFKPGKTTVFIRAQTPDPLVLLVYLNSIDSTFSRQSADSYSYGFLYGGIFVLMAYNLILYFSLRNLKYFLYSVYLACFLLVNFSYTGHAYKTIWPDSPQWQMWSNPVLMVAYSIAGLMFAIRFLGMKKLYPRISNSVIYSCVIALVLLLYAILTSNHLLSLLVAFTFMLSFSFAMPMLGLIALYAKDKSAKYFLIASVVHATAAGVTVMVVWGFVPYSTLGYRIIDIGMMIDATLLAMALAYQFKTVRDEKNQAEKLAQVDPLTQLNNRRAFHDFVLPMWSNSIRYQHAASIIIIDIDRFKLINDRYGHAQGDDVLVEVAKTLKNGTRTGDVLARWGGEEFIIFLPDTKRSEAAVLAQRFCNSIEKIHIKTVSDTITVTISIGVSDNENNPESLGKVIAQADGNLFQAKAQGRNRVVSSVSA